MAKSVEMYKWIKAAGMISFIPIILAAGPFTGYFAGEYLKNKFGLGNYIIFICISLGTVASIKEIISIIRKLIQIDKKTTEKHSAAKPQPKTCNRMNTDGRRYE